jgi:hypothetical protein
VEGAALFLGITWALEGRGFVQGCGVVLVSTAPWLRGKSMRWVFVVVSHPSRASLLIRLLDSIHVEEGEIRLVWQSQKEDPPPMPSSLPIRIWRTQDRCLSCARNLALGSLDGEEVVAFPDDDAWYPPDTLRKVSMVLDAHPDWGGVVGQLVTEEGIPTGNRYLSGPGPLTPHTLWRVVSASTLFLRAVSLQRVGGFREDLGLGAPTPYQAAEDAELVWRLLNAGIHLEYTPEVRVYHKQTESREVLTPGRYRAYGRGMGRVLRLHKAPLGEVAYHILRPLGGALLALLKGDFYRARVHLAGARGRWEGWADRCG